MEETKEKINARFLEQFVHLPGFWAGGKSASEALFDTGDESATLIFTDVLVDGLGGQVIYTDRVPSYLAEDTAMSDDFLTLGIDPEKVDCAIFCRDTMPRLIEIIGAYRATFKTDRKIG